MQECKTRTIVVLFTCYKDMMSNFVYYLTGRSYTHTSVSIDEGSEYYYSFNKKGFCKEYPKRYRKKMRDKSKAIYLEVSEESWQSIQEYLKKMESASEAYHYNSLGVFTCLMKIAWPRKKHYFCSQFVSELLGLTDEIHLTKDPSLYLPCQLEKELLESPFLKQIEVQPV